MVISKPANDGRGKAGRPTVFGTMFFYPACSSSGKYELVPKPSVALPAATRTNPRGRTFSSRESTETRKAKPVEDSLLVRWWARLRRSS